MQHYHRQLPQVSTAKSYLFCTFFSCLFQLEKYCAIVRVKTLTAQWLYSSEPQFSQRQMVDVIRFKVSMSGAQTITTRQWPQCGGHPREKQHFIRSITHTHLLLILLLLLLFFTNFLFWLFISADARASSSARLTTHITRHYLSWRVHLCFILSYPPTAKLAWIRQL